jgi:predicted peptidase
MRFAFAFIISILSFSLHAQDLNEYKKEIFTRKDRYLPYRILFPLAFDTSRRYPLLIFLHGAYEKGNNNEAQLDIGGRYFLADSNRSNFPAVIVFPQCASNDVWAYFDAEFDSAGVLKNGPSSLFAKNQRLSRRC